MSISETMNRLIHPPNGGGGHAMKNVDTIGADLKTSQGRINEKSKMQMSICGVPPCERSQERRMEGRYECAFICIMKQCKLY